MYLKSLTLKGFKSFADRTTMAFDPGLTVVVGPNGSGKSNISDAILWVLGEQSAKMLRGQAMEDVIFSGSTARQAVGLAEVTLVLDNTDQTLPIDFAEVAITRRMYRSGESEYLINGAPARLMDITDILHDSGLGKETHSIISQGKLDSILSSRAEERRELIEEAAGISKHRRRKARSERKLRSMDENLTRAKDIAREVNRQLGPLERQVDKARRHHELAERLATLSTTLAVDDLRQLQQRYNQLLAEQREAEAAVELAQLRATEREGDLERYQTLLEEKGIFVGDLGEQRRRMRDILGRMDSDMRLLEEKGKNMVARLSEMRATLSSTERARVDAAAEHERVEAELAEARGSARELEARISELTPEARDASERRRALGGRVAQITADQRQAQREADAETLAYAKLTDQIANAETEDQLFAGRLAQIAETVATTEETISARRARKGELEAEATAAREAAERADREIRTASDALVAARKAEGTAREQLQNARATLKALEAVEVQSERGSDRASALLSSPDAGLVECRVADLIEVEPGLEELVERLLGADLTAFVVADTTAATALAARAEGLTTASGRSTIVTRSAVRRSMAAGPGEPLLAHVQVAPGAEGLVEALLGDVRLVADAREAVLAHEQEPQFSYVSPSGVVALPDGRVVVGEGAGEARGALERKRRIRALRAGMESLEEALASTTAEVSSAEQALTQAREASAEAKGEAGRLAGEISSVTSELGRLEAQLTQAVSERAQVERRRAAAASKADEARAQIGRHRQAADEAAARATELSETLEETQRERSRASREEADLAERLSSLRLELATVSERRNHLAVREEALARSLADAERRREATLSSARALDVLRLRVDPLHERYEAIHERALAWDARLKDRASLAEADSDSLKATIAEARAAVTTARGELERAQARTSELKVDLGRIEVQVQGALTAITADGWTLEDALALDAPEDRTAAEREVERLRKQLASIGPVNEVAMEEYTRLKARADHIAEQVADLEAARKALTKITAAIERKMRRQFLVVFDQVNANFSEVFSLLFPGGSAHIEMTDPDNVFETGIEVVAQPRGKKIQKMTLMSGGEKSLTALALLFAVYRTRTVPFYVFDEVEAALDDSNLGKLLDAIEQLKDTTQLIVISHQRRTMEQADVLYGVSMQADGVSRVVSQRLDRD